MEAPGIETGALIIGVSTVLLLAGGGLVAAGASLLARSSAPTPRAQKTAFVRQPTWVGPQGVSPPKRPFVVPISFSF